MSMSANAHLTSLSDTIMTSTDSSIHTNLAALFGVEGQVAVVTGGGTGTALFWHCVKSRSSYHVC